MLVYLITNSVNGKQYVGKTTQTLARRWTEHKSEARNNRKEWKLYVEMRELGIENFTISVLGVASYQKRLNAMERKFIRVLKPAYNTRVEGGGGGLKKKLSNPSPRPEYVKQKIRQTLMETLQRKNNVRLEVNAN